MKEQFLLNVSIFANVEETDFSFVDKETFRFKTPDVDIDIIGGSKVPLGDTVEVKAAFSNPLPIPLTGVVWFVEGAGLTAPVKVNGRYTVCVCVCVCPSECTCYVLFCWIL